MTAFVGIRRTMDDSFFSRIEGHERLPEEPEIDMEGDLVVDNDLRELFSELDCSEFILREFAFRVKLASLRDLSVAVCWDMAEWVRQLGPRAAVRLRRETFVVSRLGHVPKLVELAKQNVPVELSTADKRAFAREVDNHYEFQKWEKRLRQAVRNEVDLWSSTGSAVTPIPDEVALLPVNDRRGRDNLPHEREPSMEKIVEQDVESSVSPEDDTHCATTNLLNYTIPSELDQSPGSPQLEDDLEEGEKEKAKEQDKENDSESDSYNEAGDICSTRKCVLHLLLILNVLSMFLVVRLVIRKTAPWEPQDTRKFTNRGCIRSAHQGTIFSQTRRFVKNGLRWDKL